MISQNNDSWLQRDEYHTKEEQRSYDRFWTAVWLVVPVFSASVLYAIGVQITPLFGLSMPVLLGFALILFVFSYWLGWIILMQGCEIGNGSAEGAPEIFAIQQILVGGAMGVLLGSIHRPLGFLAVALMAVIYSYFLLHLTKHVMKSSKRAAIRRFERRGYTR